MIPRIETTHDLADWLEAIYPEVPSVKELVANFRIAPPETWKKCQKCLKIHPATFFDEVLNNRDGLSHKCKDCRRKIHARNARRKRANSRIDAGDLAEIQRHRAAKGLKPLPYGPDAPKPGRPRENDGDFLSNV